MLNHYLMFGPYCLWPICNKRFDKAWGDNWFIHVRAHHRPGVCLIHWIFHLRLKVSLHLASDKLFEQRFDLTWYLSFDSRLSQAIVLWIFLSHFATTCKRCLVVQKIHLCETCCVSCVFEAILLNIYVARDVFLLHCGMCTWCHQIYRSYFLMASGWVCFRAHYESWRIQWANCVMHSCEVSTSAQLVWVTHITSCCQINLRLTNRYVSI